MAAPPTSPAPPPQPFAGHARRRALVAGMASYLDAGALVTSGLAIGGFYVEAIQLSGFEVGALLGLQTLCFAIGAIVGGRLSDRLGRRTVLVVSLVFFAVGMAVLASAWFTSMLVVGVVLAGLSIGADLPASLAIISEAAPPGRRGRHVALSQLMWVAGIGTAGLLGFALADLEAWAGRLSFLYLLIVSMVVLVMRFDLEESAEWRRASAEPQKVSTAPYESNQPRRTRPSRTTVMALVLGSYYTLWNLCANTLGQFKPYLWIQVLGGDARGASALILIAIPIGLLTSVAFMSVADSKFRHRWVVAGSATATAGWVAMAIWPSRGTFAALTVLFIVGASLSGEVVYKLWVQELVPTMARATVQGATMAVARVVAAAAAVCTPLVASHDSRLLFITLSIAAVLSSVMILWVLMAHRTWAQQR